MSGETTNPNGSSKRELKEVKEKPEEIKKRISEAGYGSIVSGIVVGTHAIQFEVSDDREKAGNNQETSEFMKAGNEVDKKFIPEEQALGLVGPLKNKERSNDNKEEKEQTEREDK